MKPYLRFVKLFAAFFIILTAAWFLWVAYTSEEILNPGHVVDIGDRTGFGCIFLAAIGLAILWQDWRSTRI
jgi:hypothetical protein